MADSNLVARLRADLSLAQAYKAMREAADALAEQAETIERLRGALERIKIPTVRAAPETTSAIGGAERFSAGGESPRPPTNTTQGMEFRHCYFGHRQGGAGLTTFYGGFAVVPLESFLDGPTEQERSLCEALLKEWNAETDSPR